MKKLRHLVSPISINPMFNTLSARTLGKTYEDLAFYLRSHQLSELLYLEGSKVYFCSQKCLTATLEG